MAVKIVIVDDDRVTRAILEKTLILQGYWVYSASNGTTGFELIQQEKPDILISDILIPSIHGFDLCRKVKESDELVHTKVILMTAVYKDIPFRNEAKKCGADDFIIKPLDMKEVAAKIEKILKEG